MPLCLRRPRAPDHSSFLAASCGRRGTLTLILFLAMGGEAAGRSFSEQERAEILSILREALRHDPSLLREGLRALQEAEEREQAEGIRAAIARHRGQLFEDGQTPLRGNPRGDVALVEFFDLRCLYCRRLFAETTVLIRRDRGVRILLRDLPILGAESVAAARALLAAQLQGRYVALYEALMSGPELPNGAVIRATAQRIGLDLARLERDMGDPAIGRRIEANLALARAIGIQGTPALVIGERLVTGFVPAADLAVLIDEERRRRG